MNESNVTAEAMQKKFQGYRTKSVPQTCTHCRHVKGGEVYTCGHDKVVNFVVVPLGTCNFWEANND